MVSGKPAFAVYPDYRYTLPVSINYKIPKISYHLQVISLCHCKTMDELMKEALKMHPGM